MKGWGWNNKALVRGWLFADDFIDASQASRRLLMLYVGTLTGGD